MEMLRDQKNDESFPCCIAFDFFNGFDELKAFGALESIQEVLGLHEFCIHGSSRNLNFCITEPVIKILVTPQLTKIFNFLY